MCEQYSTCVEYRTKQQKEPMIVMQVPIIRGKKLPGVYSLLTVSCTFLLGTISLNSSSTPNRRMTRQVRP